jgi:hypothetical protein
MGAEGSMSDIDIAHRVKPRRNNGAQARPIVCKFVRRLAREQLSYGSEMKHAKC